MQRQYVFVSHASGDKPRLKFLVDALIDAGLKVWLDNPRAMGYSAPEIAAHFVDLRGGGRWREQIDDALVEAMCVVVAWTEASADPRRKVIRNEVAVARAHKKLVACRIDADFNPGILDDGYGDEQIVDVSAGKSEDCQPLIADIRRVMARISRSGLTERRLRDPFAPYLIDRQSQETGASRLIRSVETGGVAALFVKGPRNECLDQFRERLQRVTAPSCLASEACWSEYIVDWPRTDNRDAFLEAYEDTLARTLRVRPADLGKQLSRGRVVAPISIVRLRDWRDGQKHRVLDWLAFWQKVQSAHRDARLVPSLMVDLPATPPNWTRMPPVREDGISARRVARDVAWAAKRAARSDIHAPLTILPTLHPVTETDARNWKRRLVDTTTGEDWQTLDQEITSAFQQGGRRRKRISLEDFASRLSPFFKAGQNPAETLP